MRWGTMLVAVIAAMLVMTTDAYGVAPIDGCHVVECEDGKVFCSPSSVSDETQGAGATEAVQCVARNLDVACSEVPACGRRVPAVGIAGLSLLGLGMAGAGSLFLRWRRDARR
jgi:hypothetical protein